MSDLKTYYIIRDDIIFKKGQIEFDVKRLKIILKPVKIPGVIESLNTIKTDYFKRLYGKKAFKISFSNGELITDKEASPGWERLFDALELVREFYELKYVKSQKGILRNNIRLNGKEILEVYDDLLSRTEYLKYLAQRIGSDYKLIPVLEYSNGNVEDSFLFRFSNKKGDIVIVWENVNLNRATYIFKYNQERHPDILQKLEHFISSEDYTYKRSLLSGNERNSKLIKRDLCFYKKYPHHSFMDYKAEIEFIINYS